MIDSAIEKRRRCLRMCQITQRRLSLRHLCYCCIVTLFLYILHFAYRKVGVPKLSIFPLPPNEHLPSDIWENRAEQVKQAFLHAYHGYETYAAPFDELL